MYERSGDCPRTSPTQFNLVNATDETSGVGGSLFIEKPFSTDQYGVSTKSLAGGIACKLVQMVLFT
jgi:hypothetical protein